MNDNRWAVKCAIIFLILVTAVNLGVAIWSNLEFSRLTKDLKNSGQEVSMKTGLENVVDSMSRIVDNLSPDKPQIDEVEFDKLQERLEQLKKISYISFDLYECKFNCKFNNNYNIIFT